MTRTWLTCWREILSRKEGFLKPTPHVHIFSFTTIAFSNNYCFTLFTSKRLLSNQHPKNTCFNSSFINVDNLIFTTGLYIFVKENFWRKIGKFLSLRQIDFCVCFFVANIDRDLTDRKLWPVNLALSM